MTEPQPMKMKSKRRIPAGIWILAPLIVIPVMLLVPTPKELRRNQAFEAIDKKYLKLTSDQILMYQSLKLIAVKDPAEKDRVVIFPGTYPPRNIAYYTLGNLSSKFSLWSVQKIGVWIVPVWNRESPLSNLAFQVALGTQNENVANFSIDLVATPSKLTQNQKQALLLTKSSPLSESVLRERQTILEKNFERASLLKGFGVAIIQGKHYLLSRESDAIDLMKQYPD
jgi:hypothetical protein